MNRDLLRDLGAVLAAAVLVVTAVLVGNAIEHRNGSLFVHWPPLFADWDPHLGPGTPAALVPAVAVVAYGPPLAARLPWRVLLLGAWGTAMAWTWSLALIDGWKLGVAGRLTTPNEYLRAVGRFHDIPGTLRDFTHHIVAQAPAPWPVHVAGHPPASTLTFVLLDRIGLGGGAWAGVWCITVGSSACVAVLVAVRALAGEGLARRAAPFLVMAPVAVWVGTSADGYFSGVAAWSLAFLARAVSGRSPRTSALAAGLLFGLTCYLSYGLTLVVVIAGAMLLLGRDRARLVPFLLIGLAVVPAVFTLAGFNWWEAYHLLVERYYQGVGGKRPYSYWVWANLACTVIIVGPATVAGLRRAGAVLLERGALLRRDTPSGVRAPVSTPSGVRQPMGTPSAVRAPVDVPPGVHAPGGTPEFRLALLVFAALLALLAADLSGMSKAETERIWVPFALWLLPAGAFLPRPRGWLAAQAVLALLINHLLLTGW